MVGINESKPSIMQKTGIIEVAGKLGKWITDRAIAKAIPLASQLASKGGWLGKIGVSCSKLLGVSASFMAGPLGPIVGEIVGQLIIYAATNAIAHVAKKLNMIPENDKTEEIGYRLEEASKHDDWKTREQFASFGDYYNYLRTLIPTKAIDQGRIVNERLYFTMLGGDALRQGIAEHYRMDLPIDMVVEIGRIRLDGDTLKELLEGFAKKGYNITKFKSYLQGELKGVERQEIEKEIATTLSSVFPDFSTEQVKDKIQELQSASRDIAFLKSNVYKEEIAMTQAKLVNGKIVE